LCNEHLTGLTQATTLGNEHRAVGQVHLEALPLAPQFVEGTLEGLIAAELLIVDQPTGLLCV